MLGLVVYGPLLSWKAWTCSPDIRNERAAGPLRQSRQAQVVSEGLSVSTTTVTTIRPWTTSTCKYVWHRLLERESKDPGKMDHWQVILGKVQSNPGTTVARRQAADSDNVPGHLAVVLFLTCPEGMDCTWLDEGVIYQR